MPAWIVIQITRSSQKLGFSPLLDHPSTCYTLYNVIFIILKVLSIQVLRALT